MAKAVACERQWEMLTSMQWIPIFSAISCVPPSRNACGRPPGPFLTSMSRQLMPRRQPVPIALSTASLAAQRPAKCCVAIRRLRQYSISSGV